MKGRKFINMRLKKRKRQILCVQHPNSKTIFAIILAALSGDNNSQKSLLIMHCLNLIHSSVSKYLFPPFLSLLPVLLKSRCGNIASKSALIVGAASLESIEMNEMIALEDGIIRALLNLLTTSAENVLMEVCNAILDISTTSLGRQRLLRFSAIEKLSVTFAQDSKCMPTVLCLSNQTRNSGGLKIIFKEDNLTVSLLNAVLILINSCTIKQLENIPRNLCVCLNVHLKRLWEKVHQSMICSDFLNNCPKRNYYMSNINMNSLAESIFRICVSDHRQNGRFTDADKIRRSIFQEKLDFDLFISNYWEKSPLFIRGVLNDKKDNICSILADTFEFKDDFCSVLKNLTSCQPISSDELDILHFVEEVGDSLGCPLICQQDIRVVKTSQSEGEEVHYFSDQSRACGFPPHLLVNDILKCLDAYNEGYTIALRGLGFRFKGIAAIAEGLASMFGQPSSGVNMYLTPSISQGLSRHFDDHCVFVCQLSGEKMWKLYQSNLKLPCLYESTDNGPDSEVDDQSQEFLMKEGDVLYIPRGVPHEARTVIGGGDMSEGFSLHLTLAIEVEPPFEWEGFTHTALNCWFSKQKLAENQSSTSSRWDTHVSVLLLHVIIKQISNSDQDFRKACLVGSISSLNQSNTFKSLITRIYTESSFSKAVNRVEKAALNHEDIFQRERWVRNLCKDDDMWSISSVDAENISCYCNQDEERLERVFTEVSYRFCNEVMFEDVVLHYKKLLGRYKVVRNQYTNGMLSLHLTGDENTRM